MSVLVIVTICCVAARAAAHDEQRGHHGRAAGGRAPLRAAERGGARLEVGVVVMYVHSGDGGDVAARHPITVPILVDSA